MPYFSATLRSVVIMSCWWSVAMFADSKTGAISYCAGATSLWRVLTDAELVELALHFEHERENAFGDRAEVVVLELLTFRRLRTEERPPAVRRSGRAK